MSEDNEVSTGELARRMTRIEEKLDIWLAAAVQRNEYDREMRDVKATLQRHVEDDKSVFAEHGKRLTDLEAFKWLMIGSAGAGLAGGVTGIASIVAH